MAGFRVADTSTCVEVSSAKNLYVRLPSAVDPTLVGALSFFSLVDSGSITGTAYDVSPETDDDFRERVGADLILDTETFNYTAQNTGKHQYNNTTMTNAWAVGGMTTNSSGGGIVTANTATIFSTYAMFSLPATGTLCMDVELSFSAAMTTNTTVQFGLFRADFSTFPYTPTDGVYFEVTSAGMFGVLNYNGTTTSSAAFTFTPTVNKKHKYRVCTSVREVEFWIDDVLYATVETPTANGQPFASVSQCFAIRHAIGASPAAGSFQTVLGDYTVYVGGPVFDRDFGVQGNACYGSYQGLSGGTMGSLATYPNSADPTPTVPTNTSAALGTGLGGQVREVDTLAVTTDGIILSYQVPAGTVSVQGRRLRLTGVTIQSALITAAASGGPYVAQWSLAFGHTAVSLATTETATSKAPRRIPLGVQSLTAAQLLAPIVQLETIRRVFLNPIYINPGEFVAVVKKKVGTVPVGTATTPAIEHTITYDYSWE